MVYFFHHYELPVIVQQATLQHMFMRSARMNNNNNRQADNAQAAGADGGAANEQMNRENQQAPTEATPAAAAVPERPLNNANNMFVIRGAYRRRVNHLVERLRNNFYNNVFGVGLVADNNNNNNAANNLQNQPGFNNLTRSLRLLNLLFPNRPILNVRIINVRSASASATVADIMRTAEGNQSAENANVNQQSVAGDGSEFPSVVRLDVRPNEESSREETTAEATSTISDEQPSPPDPSFANDATAEPECSIKHRATGGGDVNNSVNVMQTSTNGEGESSQTTANSSNEQCWAWTRSVFSYEF